jgi:hypothetical protein
MSTAEFQKSLESKSPPRGLSPLLEALWYDAHGDWPKAHDITQTIDNSDGAWVHAYLHRKEGDNSNASYWYRKAGRVMPSVSLAEEWKEIVSQLISRS